MHSCAKAQNVPEEKGQKGKRIGKKITQDLQRRRGDERRKGAETDLHYTQSLPQGHSDRDMRLLADTHRTCHLLVA